MEELNKRISDIEDKVFNNDKRITVIENRLFGNGLSDDIKSLKSNIKMLNDEITELKVKFASYSTLVNVMKAVLIIVIANLLVTILRYFVKP